MKKHLFILVPSVLRLRTGFLCTLAALLLSGCQSAAASDVVSFDESPASTESIVSFDEQPPTAYPSTEESMSQAPPAFEEYDVTLMAIGDNLLHMGVIYTGLSDDGSYDFSFLFEGIEEFLAQSDVKIINQETILGGNERGFSGYPHFNSPTEVGDAIADAGFQVVLHATNHTADQGISGIDSCIAYWKTHPEVALAGIHEPQETDASTFITLESNGITFAILNYTYGPNYEIVSSDLAKRLDLLCARNESSGALDFTSLDPQVLTDIAKADELADVVVVCPHWGTEYAVTPSSYQESFAEQMTEAGADVIIGTHPHVVQPVTWIDAPNGNRALCYYSLGNYVSTQKNGQSMLEALAWITFHVSEEGVAISEEKTGVLPMVCHYTAGPVRIQKIYLLEDYTQELAASHGIIPYGGISFSLEQLQTWSNSILGDWVLTKEETLYNASSDSTY